MSHRCTALRKDGSPCRSWAVPGTEPPRCSVHGGARSLADAPDRRCTATCADGSPCGGWAVPGSDPPRCGAHSDRAGQPPPPERRCTARRADGSRCEGWAMEGSDPPRCGVHGPYRSPEAKGRRCTATCEDGSPCRGWAVHGSDPPRCGPHGGGRRPAGPPEGNQNRLTHGFYAESDPPERGSIDALIEDLHQRWIRLGTYLDRRFRSGTPPVRTMRNALKLYGQSSSKLAKLLDLRRARADAKAAARMRAAVNQALDALSEELGVDL